MRRLPLLLALALVCLAPALPGEDPAGAPEQVSFFLVDQESRPRLLPGSTRFEESVLRQANLTEREALRRHPGGPTNACLARAFESLKALCGAQPAPLELDEEASPATQNPRREKTLDLPSTFRRPEPAPAGEDEEIRHESLPAPKPPPRSLRCPLSAFREDLAAALDARAREAGVESLYVSLLLTTRLPPSRADKREYWRLYGARRDYQNETEARAGSADTRQGREFDTPNQRRYDVEVGDFERDIPDFDDADPLLRLQLRGEAPDGHVELLAGRLLAKLPRGEDESFDAEGACTIDANALLAMLRR